MPWGQLKSLDSKQIKENSLLEQVSNEVADPSKPKRPWCATQDTINSFGLERAP